MRMKFYKNLYIGETIKNPNKVKWKLRCNAGQLNVYVIALAPGRDYLEIYHSGILKQKYYRKYPPFIIGIANGYEEAMNMVVRIVEEALSITGSPDVKKYLFKE